MKRMKRMGLVTLIASVVLVSCMKEPLEDLNTEESRIYITERDSTVDFNSYKTFSISDSVAVINNGSVTREQTNVDVAFISAVRTALTARGYTEVARGSDPDLGVNVNRIYNTTTGLIANNTYWDYYGGYWDPYYWGYPGYNYYIPYSYTSYRITEGALSVDLLDLKNAGSNQIRLIWTGLIRGSGIFNSSTAASQVNALFDQSTYIRTNN